MATAQELGIGGVNAAGKPVFVATDPALYVATEKETLTTRERLEYKSYKLWQATRAMERRDNVLAAALRSSGTSDMKASVLGTPYPIIEPEPTFFDALTAMRPYEHALSLLGTAARMTWMNARSPIRQKRMSFEYGSAVFMQTFGMLELLFIWRSTQRLTGDVENDHECRKYGVVEDKTRLQRKKELWARYVAHKREWGRRYDYHIFGMRPGEHTTLLSPVWLPIWLPSYGTTVDYPARKNPYFVSTKPLQPMVMHSPTILRIPADERVPIVHVRPELKYIYHGPIDAERGPPGTSHDVAG